MMIEHVPLGRFAHLVAHSKRLGKADQPVKNLSQKNVRKGLKSAKRGEKGPFFSTI
jgi:hypothetical protein